MTVPSETNRSGPYNGNGSTTVFDYQFRIVDENHLRVVLTDALGIETDLAIDTDYIVSDVGDEAGGQIALTTAPAVDETVTILRDVPFVQETDLQNQGAYYAETVEDALDLAAMRDQQLDERVSRSLKMPPSYGGDADPTLPVPESNALIGWNEEATELQNVDPQTLGSIIVYGTANSDIFTGDGVTTQFNLSANPGALNNLDVAINGVTQLPGTDYAWTSGTLLTFTTAPANGLTILARYMQALAQGTSDGATTSFIQAGTGAVTRTMQDKAREIVSVKDFGAVEDGVTDDSTAVQRAVDALLSSSSAGALLVSGQCYLAHSINIDRMIDTSGDDLMIWGRGKNAGFRVTTGIPMFTSTIAPSGTQPRSEFVTFQDIRFDGPGSDVGAAVCSERFLRMKFIGCRFYQIKCMNAVTTFAQEWSFERCNVVGPRGMFFSSEGAYYVNAHGCKFRDGTAGVFDLVDGTNNSGVVGCSFVQNVIESNAGSFVKASLTRGLAVIGNYTENNGAANVVLTTTGGGRNEGVLISGNRLQASPANIASTSYADIVWGAGGGVSQGNSCASNLHDNTACSQIDLISNGDQVTPGKKLMLAASAQIDLIPDPASGYASLCTSGYVVAYPVNGVPAHTIALPPPKSGGRIVRIANRLTGGSQTFTVLPSSAADGSKFRGGAANAGLVQGAGITCDYIPSEDGTYDRIVF